MSELTAHESTSNVDTNCGSKSSKRCSSNAKYSNRAAINKSLSPKRDGHSNTKTNPGPDRNPKFKSSKDKGQSHHKNSKSPVRNRNANQSKSPVRKSGGHRRRKKLEVPPAAMTVIVNRCDLRDSTVQFQSEDWVQPHSEHPKVHVNPYWFATDSPNGPPLDIANSMSYQPPRDNRTVLVTRVPYHMEQVEFPMSSSDDVMGDVIDTSTPNPHDPNVVHDKYWTQRRRLFSRFDLGCQLDAEGWYSVTPELIADHVAKRVADLAANIIAVQQQQPLHDSLEQQQQGIVILDAFCGCGGNSIAFGKLPSHLVSKVVCVDMDRSKLLKAAHNASLYDIPKNKLVFVECNSIFILKYCYKNGEFVLDQPTTVLPQYMPPPIMPTTHAGYQIGGLDMLPRHIDLAFFDPPWGGVDYEILGKNGYDLEKNMKIRIDPAPCEEDPYEGDGDGVDDFFDTFAAPKPQLSKNARKKNFNKKTEGEFVNGKELFTLAADATRSRVVLFDLPRNTSKTSLGMCALAAGYRGNIKLEEHYLNGRLKTVTAYLGSDYSGLINNSVIGAEYVTTDDEDV